MTSDTSSGSGCAQFGCGFVGLGLASLIALITVSVSPTTFSVFELFVVPFFLLFPAAILGAIGQNLSWVPSTARKLGTVGKYLLGFAVLFLITAIGLTLRPGDFSYEGQVPAEGGTLGPITVEKEGMRVGVEVEQHIQEGEGTRYKRWSFVTIELLDENKEYLSSFGGGFWHYAGYDGGEYWEEEDDEFEAALQIPSSGTYYLKFETEANVNTSALYPVQIEMYEQSRWGDPGPLKAGGYAAFFLGIFFLIISAKDESSSSDGDGEWEVEIEAEDDFDVGGEDDFDDF